MLRRMWYGDDSNNRISAEGPKGGDNTNAAARVMKAAAGGSSKPLTYRTGDNSMISTSETTEFNPTAMALPAPGETNPSIWWYVLAAILDLEANFLVITAFNYTSITSIALLDCFTIPSAMILSYFFLEARYVLRHYLGVGICLLGMVCIVLSDRFADAEGGNSDSSKTAFFGDMICIAGAFFYACSNVLQEKLVKYSEREVYVGRIGGFGMVFAVIQFMATEYQGYLAVAPLTQEAWLFIAGFVLTLFFFYANASAFLQSSDSIIFNLSLLTADVYTVIYSYFKVGYLVGPLYFVSFGMVAVGLYLYHSEKSPQGGSGTGTNGGGAYALHENSSIVGIDHGNGNDYPEGGLEDAREEIASAFAYNPLSEMGDDDSEHPEYTF
jgi:drug/metabolite transporter (DMT)-like permease